MAVSQEQKVDFLLKKLGFTKTKTGLAVDSTLSGTKKAGFAEAIPSPLIIANSSVWNEADSIPATPPGSDTNQVRVYLAATSGHRMTVDSTVANNRAFIAFSTYNNTSSARLNNWIDTQFGAGYLIKVFRGDPNGGGVQLSAAGSGNNDGWFFDYSAGVLNFNDTNVPSGVSGTNIYVVGYRYIGQTGAPTSGISTFSFLDLSVERNLDVGSQGGISTFRNNIDLNADLDVAGVSTFAGITTVTGNTLFSKQLNVSAASTFGGNTRITGSGNIILGNISSNNYLSLNNPNTSYSKFSYNGSQTIIQSLNQFYVNVWDGNGYENFLGIHGPNSTLSLGGDIVGATRMPKILISGHTSGNKIQFYSSSGTSNNERFNLVDSGITITGLTTFVGNIDANGDLDVDGHTNLDNVSVAGVTTFSNNVRLLERDRLQLGNSQEFQIYYGLRDYNNTDDHAVIRNSTGNLYIQEDSHIVFETPAGSDMASMSAGDAVKLFFNGTQKFQTTNTGITVAGTVVATGADINGDIDVDGHTNLDNVNISGMTTMSGNLQVGRITASDYIRTSSQLQIFSTNPTIVLADTDSENDFNIKNNNGTFTVQDADSSIDRFKITSSGQATITGDLDVTRHLDVDGHTDLDNVSIAGVTTFTGNAIVDGVLTVKSGNETQDRLQVGDSGQLRIYHAGHNYYRSNNATSNHIFTVNGPQVVMSLGSNGTANLFYQGSKKLSTTNTGIDVTGDANFSGNVSIGGTLTYEDVKNIDSVGIITARDGIRVTGGVIEALAGENKIPALYSAMSNLPSAGTYHGMFAHVHATGRGYFAHAGNWMELVNKEVNGVVGTGTETYNIGNLVSTSSTTTSLNVTGVSTFASSIHVADSIIHEGDTDTKIEFATNQIKLTAANKLRIDLSSNHYNYLYGTQLIQADSTHPKPSGATYVARFRDTTGDNTEIQFFNTNVTNTIFAWNDYGNSTSAGNLVFKGNSGGSGLEHARFTGSGNFKLLRDLDVDGHTNLDNVNIVGVTTVAGDILPATTATYNLGTNNAGGIGNGRFNNAYFKTSVWILDSTGGFMLGNSGDTKFYHTGTGTLIDHSGTGSFGIRSNNGINFSCSTSAGETAMQIIKDGGIKLYHNFSGTTSSTLRFETTGQGINVIGHSELDNVNISGVTTTAGNVDINADLDVDGHTNLDNVSIAGVSTFSNTVHIGTGTTIESNGQATFTGITTFHNFIRLPNYNPGTTVGKIQIGELQGYEIFHYNNNNYLTFTRDLLIRGDNIGRQIKIQPKISQEGIIVKPDAAVELYHNGTKQWETTSLGTLATGSHHYLNNNNASIFFGGSSGNYGVNAGIGIAQQGNYHITGSGAGDLCIAAKTGENLLFGTRVSGSGAAYKAAKIHSDFTFEVNGDLQLPNDTKKIQIGTSQDLQLYHDGSNSLLTNSTGTLLIRADNLDLRPNTNSSEVYLRCTQNAGVELRYDSVKKFETTSTGVNITGFVSAT